LFGSLPNDYAKSDKENDDLEPQPKDTYAEAIGKLHKAISDDEETTASTLNKLNNSLGFDDNGNYNPTQKDLSGKNVTEAIDSIEGNVNTAQDNIAILQEDITNLNTTITNLLNWIEV